MPSFGRRGPQPAGLALSPPCSAQPGSSFPPRLDPSASLDFLWACIHVPRIWQGRDQRTPQAGFGVHPPRRVG